MTGRPNILWFCADAQRWDTIAALGNPHIRTPSLDRLVAGGTAFARAYAQNPICTPSRASFLTGRYPASHHVYRNGNAGFPAGERLVTRILADAGYDCGLVGRLHLSTAKRGEARPDDGYRVFRWSNLPLPDACDAQNQYFTWLRVEKGVDPAELYADHPGFCGAGVPAALHHTTWCAEMALRFIDEPRDRPWLLSVNTFDPHPPFDPPAEYLAGYDPAALPPPLFRESDIARQPMFANIRQQAMRAVDPAGPMPAARAAHDQAARTYKPPDTFNGRTIKAAYYAMISLVDAQFGRILDHLQAQGVLENTLVVYHADHGELLGDHGLVFKGCRFFEGAVHVPLILHWPGRVRAGLVAPALVELVDIAPTLLEAAGLAPPEAMQGRSLLPILEGRADPARHKARVVADFNDSLGYSRSRPTPRRP